MALDCLGGECQLKLTGLPLQALEAHCTVGECRAPGNGSATGGRFAACTPRAAVCVGASGTAAGVGLPIIIVG